MIPKKSKRWFQSLIIKIKNRNLKNNNPRKSQNNHKRNNLRKNSKVKAIKRNKIHKENKNSKIKMINKNKNKMRNKKKKNLRKNKNQKEVSTLQVLSLFLLLCPILNKVRLNKNKLTVKKDYFLYFCIALHL